MVSCDANTHEVCSSRLLEVSEQGIAGEKRFSVICMIAPTVSPGCGEQRGNEMYSMQERTFTVPTEAR